jgi:hypothetical protein
MKIAGLIYGQRTLDQLGEINFTYDDHNMKADLRFADEPGYFSSSSAPRADRVTGQITKNGEEVSNFEGSWLENLKFDDKLYWELETTEVIKPVLIAKCLPSDARYREDSIAVGSGDMELAAKEKHRLEVLQRADRALRQEADKRRKKLEGGK